MAGRESEYTRGYLRGLGHMMMLITSGKVKKLDKTNVMRYAQELMEEHRRENG